MTFFGVSIQKPKLTGWLVHIISVILSLVSNRMSHEQLFERFGRVPFVPESWNVNFLKGVSQADAYAIGLTLLIFVLSVNLFRFAYSAIFHAVTSWKSRRVDQSLANFFVCLVATAGITFVLVMAIRFSWSQTNIIAKVERTQRDAGEIESHPAVIAAIEREKKADELYQKAELAASDKKIAELQRKAANLESKGVWYRQGKDSTVSQADAYQLFKSYKQQGASYTNLVATLVDNKAAAERSLLAAQARTRTVIDSVAQVGHIEKETTDNSVGPILESGIVILCLVGFLLLGKKDGVLPVVGYSFSKPQPAKSMQTEQPAAPEVSAQAQEPVQVTNSEQMIEKLQAGGFKVEKPKACPFPIYKDQKQQRVAIKEWLFSEFDKDPNPSRNGLQATIREFTGKGKSTVSGFTNSAFKEWQEARNAERSAERSDNQGQKPLSVISKQA